MGRELSIPHICHFSYTSRIFENQILHQKKWLRAPKTLKMSLKKSNICIFFTQSGKIYTCRKFLHRHVCGVCDKYEVCTRVSQKNKSLIFFNRLRGRSRCRERRRSRTRSRHTWRYRSRLRHVRRRSRRSRSRKTMSV